MFQEKGKINPKRGRERPILKKHFSHLFKGWSGAEAKTGSPPFLADDHVEATRAGFRPGPRYFSSCLFQFSGVSSSVSGSGCGSGSSPGLGLIAILKNIEIVIPSYKQMWLTILNFS